MGLLLLMVLGGCGSDSAKLEVRWENPCSTAVEVWRFAGPSFDDGVAEVTLVEPGKTYSYIGEGGVAYAIPQPITAKSSIS
jgi:hypothetical protein